MIAKQTRASLKVIGTSALGILTLSALTRADAATQPVAGEQPAHRAEQAKLWADIGKLPNFWEGSWHGTANIWEVFREPPAYTPSARQYIENYRPPEDTSFANCKPLGMPMAMNVVSMPIKFFPSPGMIGLYVEVTGLTRFIHVDGRQHSARPNPTYLGESIGHWEGDTLVVDTTGFVPDTMFQVAAKAAGPEGATGGEDVLPILGPHGPNLRFVERMRLKDFNTLEIQTTVHDDTVFSKPYAFPPRYWRRLTSRNAEPQEWACTDNRDFVDPETGKLERDVKDKAKDR